MIVPRLLILALMAAGCTELDSSTPVLTTRAAPRSAASTTPTPNAPQADEVPKESPKKTEETEPEEMKEPDPEAPPPMPKGLVPLNKQKTLFFAKDGQGNRSVYLLAKMVLREGPLEVMLCKLNTKEHESLLSLDADAREIHAALVAAGAKPGKPVQFINPKTREEEYKPATGSEIAISLTYHKAGKLVTVPAQHWIKDLTTRKEMAHPWVFAGSKLLVDPDDSAKIFYTANQGEVISISNFPDAMMDLPVKSSREASELQFVAWTDRLPPKGTVVLVKLSVQKE